MRIHSIQIRTVFNLPDLLQSVPHPGIRYGANSKGIYYTSNCSFHILPGLASCVCIYIFISFLYLFNLFSTVCPHPTVLCIGSCLHTRFYSKYHCKWSTPRSKTHRISGSIQSGHGSLCLFIYDHSRSGSSH